MVRDQAAARRSRAGGQPRHHAATYPATVTSVSGHAAITIANASSHPAALTALRTSHRHAVSLSHDQTVIAAARAGTRMAGSSRTAILGWSPGGSEAAARVTTGRAAGAVR